MNAAFTRYAPAEPYWQAAGMAIAWSASLAAGALFHRWVEVPLSGFVTRIAQHVGARPVAA